MTILLEQPRSDTKSPLSPVTHGKHFQGYSTTRTRLYRSSCRGGTELAGLWSQNGEESGSQQWRDILIFGDGKSVGGQI